ncbi:carcinoembryonic antigen-related cell adhesion molecule 21-like [Petaurus breviceps papuanus]|uniref:carcinoembryonic antigen-related cell adhesion molecule 21-like n=1 Tax=Petaurus breviceps papuanus TaxID=3040969 RepID=UPI0036D94F34
MESPSLAPHSGSSLWKELLLTASLFSCQIQPTSAQSVSVSVVPNPPYGTVGSSVILNIQGVSGQPSRCTWYRRTFDPSNPIAFYNIATGEQTTADSRLNVSSNGSLLIRDLTLSDADDYIVQILSSTSFSVVTAVGHLAVYDGPDNIMFSPSLVRDEIHTTLKNSLILECHVESYPDAKYEWRVNGTVNSKFSDYKYTIKNVSWEDSGKYTCLAWNNMTNLLVSKDVKIKVLAQESPGGGKGSSLSGGVIAGIVTGVLAEMALIGALVYFLWFRKTEGANKEDFSEKNPSASNYGEETAVYEDIVFPKDSALSAQGLGSSPAFPEVPSESAYQALDMSRVAVYEKIVPWKNPQA